MNPKTVTLVVSDFAFLIAVAALGWGVVLTMLFLVATGTACK